LIFILISLLLVAGIAFFQTIQGTFSALIMVVLTILSAAVAVNYYSPLSQAMLLEHIPDYADACALAGLFFITLVVLRSIADNMIRSNVVIYQWPDRILAGVLSLPTALIIVGIGSLAFEMLPFDDQVLLFNRFRDDGKKLSQSGIFPYADDFTSGLLARFSRGSLQNSEKFGLVHPDWPGEVSANRIGIQRESRHAVKSDKGLLTVSKAWTSESPLLVKEYPVQENRYSSTAIKVVDKRMPADGKKYLVIQLQMSPQLADSDGYHRFGWGQIRLVGFTRVPDLKTALDSNARPINIYAIGVRDPDLPAEFNYLRVKVPLPKPADDDEATQKYRNYGISSNSGQVDVVFEVPSEDFVPWYVEYKRYARASVPKESKAESVLPVPSASTGVPTPPVGAQIQGGWHSQYQIDPQRTAFTNELPFAITDALAKSEAEFSGGKFARGRVAGTLVAQTAAGVTQFDVPGDKRLLRLECVFSPAENSLVRSIFTSVQGVVQKKITDKNGNVHLPVGQYAMVDLPDGSKRVEMVFDPEAEMSNRLEPFRDIRSGDLANSNGRIGFLYLVSPGTELEKFEVGGGPVELLAIPLKAPQ